jgi:hypothetical protein
MLVFACLLGAHHHIDRHRVTITTLAAKRHDTQCAYSLLAAMEQILSAYEAHRSLIVQHMNGETTAID